MNQVVDQFQRPLRDLRISLTDRCNFRCVYCMPREVFGRDYRFLSRAELLSEAEIERLVRAFVSLGVEKLRFTGGEPLLRPELESLLERVSRIDGIQDLSLTTNAALMSRERADQLYRAGLRRINVSLDALDNTRFQQISDVNLPVEQVLDGIENARLAGFHTIKINMVVKATLNRDEILPMARYFHRTPYILRFIEFMDVGNHNGWQADSVVSAAEIVALIDQHLPLQPVGANYRGEVAKRWRYRDGGGEIGVISSITQPFCGDCHRARLSAVGQLYTCLFATEGHDLRALLRSGISDQALLARLHSLWQGRHDRYSELRGAKPLRFRPKVEMSYIGG